MAGFFYLCLYAGKNLFTYQGGKAYQQKDHR
jgi:hypothetical protein